MLFYFIYFLCNELVRSSDATKSIKSKYFPLSIDLLD